MRRRGGASISPSGDDPVPPDTLGCDGVERLLAELDALNDREIGPLALTGPRDV